MSNRIPTEEEFVRASRLMEEQSRGLDGIRARVLEHFSPVCPLHDFYIMPQRDVDFRAYVFFEADEYARSDEARGVLQALADFVYSELDQAGRGKRSEIRVAFEVDSHENVIASYEGDYFLRLR